MVSGPSKRAADQSLCSANNEVLARAVYDKSPNDLASSARRLVIEATYVL
jgi:hypothetical protein